MPTLPVGYSSSGDLGIDRRYRWASASLEAGEAEEAREILAQTVAEAPLWAAAWKLYGDALRRCGDLDRARLAYEEAERRDPEGALGASLELARLGARPSATAMRSGYVAALFDDYADRFDAHLTKVLNYRGPQTILAALQAVCHTAKRKLSFETALDLGCGTGLMGEALRPFCSHLVGVDLSARMIAKARAKLVYDRLIVGDLTDVLHAGHTEALALVVAADVLVYLSELAPVFGAIARALGRRGLFAFTLQSCPDAAAETGFRLGADNRFAHSQAHIRDGASAHGLDILHLEPAVTRQDAGEDVQGWVVVLEAR